jgi:hypothetical protein
MCANETVPQAVETSKLKTCVLTLRSVVHNPSRPFFSLPSMHYHQMFKPVRVVATIVFLVMIIMIFISAFVIHSSTLCIGKHTFVLASVYFLKRGMQYSSFSSTSRSSGIRCRTFPTHAAPSSECSALLKCSHRISVITLYDPSSACLGC